MKTNNSKESILECDRRFSKVSEERGMKEAFAEFMADDAIIYKDKNKPFSGRQKILQMLAAYPGGRLTWEPTFADVAASADLGYTLGNYVHRSPEGQISSGFYVSIWKKQADGKWKYVFDSGIEGTQSD